MIANCSLGKPLFIALAICSVPLAPALAGEIKLTMKETIISATDVAGETVTLHVPAKQVICEGDDCIEFLQASGD